MPKNIFISEDNILCQKKSEDNIHFISIRSIETEMLFHSILLTLTLTQLNHQT
jgi:hypothetical protein